MIDLSTTRWFGGRRVRTAALALMAVLLVDCGDSTSLPCGEHGDCPSPLASGVVDPLVHLGRAEGPTFIEIVDVVAHGDVVLACTGTKGLTIYDASSEDSAPTTLLDKVAPIGEGLADASFPRCQHIGLDGAADRVVITNRGDEIQPNPWLWVYDIADPTNVRAVGGWAAAPSIEGAVLEGDRVYVAMHSDGIAVVQDNGSGTFVPVGTFFDADSDAWLPVKVGDTLLVAEGATGLRTYDVAGDVPVLLATLALNGSSRDIALRGTTAYVATSQGVAAVDIQDPNAPRLLGEIEVDGTALEVAVGLGDTVITAEWDGVRGYDASDPAALLPDLSERIPSDVSRSRVLAVDADPERARVYVGEWRGLHAYTQVEGGTGPDLFVTPSELQFGSLAPGQTEDRVVVVRNRGDQPLTVSDISASAGLSVDTQCLQIEPGASAAIEVRFSPVDTQPVDAQIKFCSDDPDEPDLVIGVSANVPGVGVGDPVPAFELFDIEGNAWSPAALEGKVAVLAYFATF